MAKVDDNYFPKVILDMQTVSQAAPTDSSWKMFSKADGVYARSSNTTVGPLIASSGAGIAVTGAKAYHSTSQAVGAGATITLVFDSEEFDDASYHNTSSNTSRLTVPATGKYLFGASAFTGSSGNELELWFKKNGTTDLTGGTLVVGGTDGTQVHYSTVVSLSANDYLEARLFSKNNTNVSGSTGATGAEFWVLRQT